MSGDNGESSINVAADKVDTVDKKIYLGSSSDIAGRTADSGVLETPDQIDLIEKFANHTGSENHSMDGLINTWTQSWGETSTDHSLASFQKAAALFPRVIGLLAPEVAEEAAEKMGDYTRQVAKQVAEQDK